MSLIYIYNIDYKHHVVSNNPVMRVPPFGAFDNIEIIVKRLVYIQVGLSSNVYRYVLMYVSLIFNDVV